MVRGLCRASREEIHLASLVRTVVISIILKQFLEPSAILAENHLFLSMLYIDQQISLHLVQHEGWTVTKFVVKQPQLSALF